MNARFDEINKRLVNMQKSSQKLSEREGGLSSQKRSRANLIWTDNCSNQARYLIERKILRTS